MSGHSHLVVIDSIIASFIIYTKMSFLNGYSHSLISSFLIFFFFNVLFSEPNTFRVHFECALCSVVSDVSFFISLFFVFRIYLVFYFWNCLEFHWFSYLLPKSSNIWNRFVFHCWQMDYYYYYSREDGRVAIVSTSKSFSSMPNIRTEYTQILDNNMNMDVYCLMYVYHMAWWHSIL